MSVFLPAWLSFSDLKGLDEEESEPKQSIVHNKAPPTEAEEKKIDIVEPCRPAKKAVGVSTQGLRQRTKTKKLNNSS